MIADQLIRGRSASEGWARAFEALARAPGRRAFHLIVQIADAAAEDDAIRTVADQLLIELKNVREPTIVTVRNTIFPKTIVQLAASPEDLQSVYFSSDDRRKKFASNDKGRYFERMIARQQTRNGPRINQLAHTIEKLKTVGAARYELDMGDDEGHIVSEAVGVYQTAHDANKPVRAGFPCMSHLSFQQDGDLVHCLALYRSQDVASKAYGNYLGLGQLLRYVATGAGRRAGYLTVNAGVATIGASVRTINLHLSKLEALRTA